MKRKTFFSILTFMAVTSLFGADDVSKTMSDETQKKYERKAVMALDDLGFAQDRIDVAIQLCDGTGSVTTCIPWDFNISLPLDRAQKVKAAKEFYDWVVTSRFDKVLVGEGRAEIITKSDSISVETGAIQTFVSGTSDYSTFKSRLESYLNGQMREVMQKLLSESINARYKEMPEQEQETFMRTKAKELGVPSEFVQKMLNSSYVFGVHIDEIKGSGKITKVNKTVPLTGVKIPAYEISFDLPIDAKVLIYNYDMNQNKFVLYKEVKAWSGIGTGLFDGETMYLIPTHEQAMKAFNNTFQTSLKAAAISANMELKKDDNFAIFAPVVGTEGSKVLADIGISEDVRVDHPFAVMEKVDGEFKIKGYTKARSVFENCGEEAGQTEFGLVKGSVEQADLMREHSWTGLFFYLGGGLNGRSVQGKDEYKDIKLGGNSFGGQLGVSLDLGYALNKSFLSEVWLSLFGTFAMGGDDYKFEGTDVGWDAPIYFGGGLEISKRFYLGGSGVFLGGAAGFSYESGSASGTGDDYYKMEDMQISTLMFTPQFQLGYMFTPNFELIVKGGYNLPLSSDLKQKSSTSTDTEDEGYDINKYAEVKGGIYAMANISIHLPVVGPMSKFYSKPSAVCQDLAKKKKEEENKKKAEEAQAAPAAKQGSPEPVQQENPENTAVEQTPPQ